MILNTKNFNRFQRSIDKLTSQGSGTGRSIYLNFEESQAYVMNVQTYAQMRIAFEFELGPKEEMPKNILIDAATFKNYYQYTNSMTFNVNKNSVSVAYESVNGIVPFTMDDETFTSDSYDVNYDESVAISPNTYAQICSAAPWIVADEDDEDLEALFIHKGSIYNGDLTCLYVAPLEGMPETSTRLSKDIVTQIIFFGENCVVSEEVGENSELTRLVSSDSTAEFIEPKLLNYDFFDMPVDEEFIQEHNGEDRITVNAAELSEAIAFLDPFIAKQVAKIFFLKIEEDKLSLYTESELVGNVNKSITIASKTQDTFAVSKMNFPMVKKALKIIKEENVELTINGNIVEGAPLLKMQGTSEVNKRSANAVANMSDKYLILSKYGE